MTIKLVSHSGSSRLAVSTKCQTTGKRCIPETLQLDLGPSVVRALTQWFFCLAYPTVMCT